jgi:pantothenate synthetase
MFVKSYLDHKSEEYYLAANNQVTIFVNDSIILNNEGMKLYKSILKKINDDNINKIMIKDYVFMPMESGMWINDIESKYCVNKDISASLHSFNNYKISGVVEGSAKVITTSLIIMMNNDWCYSSTGHLYRLGDKYRDK